MSTACRRPTTTPRRAISPRSSRHLIQDFPQYYRYESEKEFIFNGIKQGNRNPLLYKDLGADGIKTGHTEEAGYGLVGSAVRNGRRVIFVLSGMQSLKERGQESERVLDWAYREFADYHHRQSGRADRRGAGVDGRGRQSIGGAAIRRGSDALAGGAQRSEGERRL